MTVTCPYCGNDARLVYGSVIYPHRRDLHLKAFYQCAPCNAYVGCHQGTRNPLGRLANEELRREKMAAHAAFDPLWKYEQMRRGDAYAWLAEALGIKKEECHIGMFDVEMCKRVVAVCEGRDEKMSGVVERIAKYAGLNKDKDRCPSNPRITVREAIELANHIEALKRENFALAAGSCCESDGLTADEGGVIYCRKTRKLKALLDKGVALNNALAALPEGTRYSVHEIQNWLYALEGPVRAFRAELEALLAASNPETSHGSR